MIFKKPPPEMHLIGLKITDSQQLKSAKKLNTVSRERCSELHLKNLDFNVEVLKLCFRIKVKALPHYRLLFIYLYAAKTKAKSHSQLSEEL